MNHMVSYRFLYSLLFPAIVLSGCKTIQIAETAPPVQQVKEPGITPSGELRGYAVYPESWVNEDADVMHNNISTLMGKVADANYNAVFLFLDKPAELLIPSPVEPGSGKLGHTIHGFDPLRIAIEEAHLQRLKIYAGIDLPGPLEWDPLPLPQVKTRLKKNIRYLIEKYDLDGLSFDLTGQPKADITLNDSLSLVKRDNQKMTDLIEDVAVEAMLVKPYLVFSLLFSVETGNQFAIHCLEEGIADFIVPKIDSGTSSPDRELMKFWNESVIREEMKPGIFPMLSMIDSTATEESVNRLYAFIIEQGGRGMVLELPYPQPGTDSLLYRYADSIKLPDNLKKVLPEQVVGLDLSALFPGNPGGQTLYLEQGNKIKTTDSEGCFGFITSNPDTIEFATSTLGEPVLLPTERWAVPYKYALQPDTSIVRKSPWVEFRRMPEKFTDDPEYHLLCRTDYPASARINGEAVKLYKTGVFFNKLTLNEGANRIRATIVTPDTLSAFYEREFIYEPVDKTRQPFPLWIDERSVEPGYQLDLLPEDIVPIRFEGSLGQKGFIEVNPGNLRIACSRENHEDYTVYQADLPLEKLPAGNSYRITLKLAASTDTTGIASIAFQLPNPVRVKNLDDFPMVKTKEDYARLTYTLGPSRLGAPIRSELGQGIILKTNGKIGSHYRIRLSRVETGMIHQNSVEELPDEAVQSPYFITSMSCYPARNADVLTIPYLEPIPYEVYPDPDQNRITITLFGAKTSSTWITHHRGRKIIDKITWQQTTPETYQIYVNLKTTRIWGYDIRPVGNLLMLTVKYPPEYNLRNKKPLSGLKIAIEAGHGGTNTGAVGLSGLLEKEINLDLSLRLAELCQSMGAEVLQVRDSDRYMSLIEKRDTARLSGADLLISIHANAGGVDKGYLGASGTSTYYNNPFWAPLAETVYDRLLELELAEFGVIGSFNYTVIRVSQMPSVLVEQAFMSNAEDEEKLADNQFRQQIAEKIYQGIIDYLKFMNQ